MPKKYKNVMETEFKADDRFSRAVGRMSAGMSRMNRIAGRLKMGLKRAGAAAMFLGRNAARFAKVGLLAMGGAATALFLGVNKLAGEMDSLAKTARSIDFPIEEFQEWRFVAEQSGVQSAVFDKSVQKFTRTMGELKGGYGALFAALKKSDKPLLKQLQNTEGVSDAMAIYLKAIGDAGPATEKAALSAAGFGRAGIDMINVANESAESIGKLRAQMRENGVVTAEQAAKAESYNDTMNRLKLTAKGLAVDGLTPLMPLIEGVAESSRKWISENKELIKQKIHMVFQNVMKFGKRAFDFLRKNVPPLIEQLRKTGSEGFAWIKENKKEIADFFGMIKAAGSMLLNVTRFVIGNKEAVLALVVAYKALGVSIGLIKWSAMATGAATAGTAIGGAAGAGGLTAKIGTLAASLGKGGILGAAVLVGVAAIAVMDHEFSKHIDNVVTKANNAAAKIGMIAHKMSNKNIESELGKQKKSQGKVDSVWTGAAALVTNRFGEWNDAKKATRQAQIDLLSEKLSRMQGGAQATGSPQAQNSKTESLKVERVEMVIKDETGRAEVTSGSMPNGLQLARTGGM